MREAKGAGHAMARSCHYRQEGLHEREREALGSFVRLFFAAPTCETTWEYPHSTPPRVIRLTVVYPFILLGEQGRWANCHVGRSYPTSHHWIGKVQCGDQYTTVAASEIASLISR